MEVNTISNGKFSNDRGPKQPAVIMNERIKSRDVRLIDDEGTNHGVIETSTAMEMADKKGLDLVLISPNQSPPVAKILDYGKYKFETEKKAKEAKKKQHTVEVKEIKMRYKIDTHDYDVRMKNIRKFIAAGNKVKVVVMLRGREFQHSKLAYNLAERVKNDMSDTPHVVERNPLMEGKSIIMILGPISS